MKSGKTMVASALEGHSKFCRSIGHVRLWGNSLQPRFCLICRAMACGQRSLSAESLFGYFCGDKSN
jgi:hypothetical protein